MIAKLVRKIAIETFYHRDTEGTEIYFIDTRITKMEILFSRIHIDNVLLSNHIVLKYLPLVSVLSVSPWFLFMSYSSLPNILL